MHGHIHTFPIRFALALQHLLFHHSEGIHGGGIGAGHQARRCAIAATEVGETLTGHGLQGAHHLVDELFQHGRAVQR